MFKNTRKVLFIILLIFLLFTQQKIIANNSSISLNVKNKNCMTEEINLFTVLIKSNNQYKKTYLQNLIIDYLPKPITAGIFPEITGEPFTIKISDQDGKPVDLSNGGKYSDDYVVKNCFFEEDIKVGYGKWLRKSIKDTENILIDFSDKDKGIYRFFGFIANDKGEFKVIIKTPEDDIKGEVVVSVELPKVKYRVMNLDDPDKNEYVIDGSENDFILTSGDLRSYKMIVEIKDANGNPIRSIDYYYSKNDIILPIKIHNYYLFYSVCFLPFTSFTPFYNYILHSEDFYNYKTTFFSIYQNTSFESGLNYNNGIPQRGGIYNFNYNYDKWQWGEMFSDLKNDKKIDSYDVFFVDKNGEVIFTIIPTDIGYISGLIGSNVSIYDKSRKNILKTFSAEVDISGSEENKPDSIMQVDYFSHVDKKIEVKFIDLKLYSLEREGDILKEVNLSKNAYDPENYDFTYGIENNLLIKAYPADKRDIPIKELITANIVGTIEIWGNEKFKNINKEIVVNIKFKPRGIGADTSYLLIMTEFEMENNENYYAKELLINLGLFKAFWLYQPSGPDFLLLKRSLKDLTNYPKFTYNINKLSRILPIFDSAKGLEISYETTYPLTVFNEIHLTIKVIEKGPKFPVSGAEVRIFGKGIDINGITDADGIVKFKLCITESGKIYIEATKINYVKGIKEIEIIENKNILPSKPNIVEINLSKLSVEIKWIASEKGTFSLGGYEIWKGKSETNFLLLDIIEPEKTSYIDKNVNLGDTYFYKIRAFDTGIPKNYSEFSNVVSIELKDTTPPELTITFPVNEMFINKSSITIIGTVSDIGSGLDILMINDSNVEVSTIGEFSYNINLIQGVNNFRITAIDKFGNKIEKTLTINVDLVSPEIIISLPNETYDSQLLVSGKVNDDYSGIENLKINGININFTSDGYFSYTLSLIKGNNKIFFEAFDNAGNRTIKEFTIRYIKRTVLKLQIGNKTMYVNDTPQEIDVPPIIIEGRTLLPIRWVAEPLGAEVGWDGVERKVTVTLKNTKIELWIAKSIARVNGVDTPIDPDNPKVVPMIISGRTMLPVRFVAENLGCKVDWNPDTKTVTITYPKD